MEWDSTLLGEDDSLIQQTPSRSKNQISPIRNTRTKADFLRRNCTTPGDMSNKENISTNKTEGPKLNVEPLQMKKKRKGGGYNLRKSLAWNRAFFTEEGVLDPVSMITGTLGNSSQDTLSTINEEGISLLSEDYQSYKDSADPQALEKNLSKEVPAVSLKEDRKIACLPSKHNSPARNNWPSSSVASHKAIPTHAASKTRSRSGDRPRPLPLSSLKRPANVNACQTVSKESKLPRIPVSKPGYSSNPATSQIVLHGATNVKQKQIAQARPFVKIQKNVGPKRSPGSAKTMQNKPKCLQAKSPINLHSSIQSHAPTAKVSGNTGPKVIPNNVGPSIIMHSSKEEDGSVPSTVSLPQNTLIKGSSMQHKQIPSTKPSGLRRPSPSLGFFGQTKVSVSICGPWRAVEAHIPGLRKVGDLRPPRLAAEIPEVVNDIIQTVDTMVLRPSFDSIADSHEKAKADIQEDVLKEGSKFSNETECSEPMCDKQMTMSSITNEKFQPSVKHETKLLFQEDKENNIKDDKLLLETEPCGYLTEYGSLSTGILDCRGGQESSCGGWESSKFLSQGNPLQCTTGLYGKENTFETSYEEEKSSNSAVADHGNQYKSRFGDVISCGLANSSTIQSNSLSSVEDHDDHHPHKKHSNTFKSSTCEAVRGPHGDKHLLVEKGNLNKLPGESQKCATENIENADCRTSEDTDIEIGNLDYSSQHKYENDIEESPMMVDVTLKSHVEERDLQESNKILTTQNYKDNLNQHLEVDDVSKPAGNCLKVQTLFLEQIPQHSHELPAADCLSDNGSEGYSKEVIEILPSVTSDERGKSESDSSDVELAQGTAHLQGGTFYMNQMAGQGFLEDSMLDAVETAHSVEDLNCLLTTDVNSDVICSDISSSTFHSPANEASKILFVGEHGTFKGSKVQNRQVEENNLMVDEPENLTISESPHPDLQAAAAESKLHDEDQKCNLQSITEADPTILDCSMIMLGKSYNLPNGDYTGQINEDEKRAEELLHDTDANVPVECYINHSLSVFDNNIAVSYCSEESGQAEYSNCSTMVDKVSQNDNELPLESNYSGERALQAEFEENTLFEIGVDTVQECNDTAGCESKISEAVSSATLSIQVSSNDVDKFIGDSYMNYAASVSVEIESSSEQDELFTKSHIDHVNELGDLLVKGDLTSSRDRNMGHNGRRKSTVPDEIKSDVPLDTNGLVEEYHSDMKSALHLTRDKDTTAPIGSKKSESTSNKNSTTILPPRNAVPFSDEWLAAIEAAGEDFLTMKSGAVQNSPPEKAEPEPSPWSPVKRKNTSVGPFDCTKFTNNLPSDSQ